MAHVYDTSPPWRANAHGGSARPDLAPAFLGIAAQAARKARLHAPSEEVARLATEAQARLEQAVALAQRQRPRPRRPA